MNQGKIIGIFGKTRKGGITVSMTRDEVAMAAMEIVAFAGDARTQFLKAMDAMAENDFAQAEALIKEGDDLVVKAHEQEKEIIAQESAGETVEISFFTIHAQDYLMTSMLLSDMCKRFMKIFRQRPA